jgi:hypothetical protein
VREWVRARRDAHSFCTYPKFVEALQQDLGTQDPNVMRSAILFLHDLGELLFFVEYGLIVLSLSWFIDLMKLIIRHGIYPFCFSLHIDKALGNLFLCGFQITSKLFSSMTKMEWK